MGDRIRMNAISHGRAYMRSLATREDNKALSAHVQEAIDICKATGFDFIILESAGVGQSDASILDYCDVSMYVMTPEYGAASQLEKINMLDYADVVCINKFDKAGALDALHDRLERLQSAILCASRNGSGFGNRCHASSIDSMLDNLIDAFLDEAVGLDGASPRVAVANESFVLES